MQLQERESHDVSYTFLQTEEQLALATIPSKNSFKKLLQFEIMCAKVIRLMNMHRKR